MTDWLAAVDFGTTANAVAVRSGDGPARAVVFGDGSSTLPSSVFAENDGRLLVGAEADNEAEFRLDAYEPTPKRRISDGQIRLGDRDFSAPELIGAVLAPALTEAMRQHGNTIPFEVVLTHPVAWRSSRRATLTEALDTVASQLGVTLPDPMFVPEPVAAARWYAQTDRPHEGAFFAVFDLGGGTFDTTVLQATGHGFEVVASGGIDPLGGFDFDAALFTYLGKRYIAAAAPELWSALSTPGATDPDMARQRRRLQQRVGLLKTGLSTNPDKRIQLPGMQGPVVVTRSEYESLIAGHVDDAIAELERVIADACLTPDQLTAIYRIGGASRTPLVGAALDRLHVPVKVLDQPKLVVAQGAASPTERPMPSSKPVPAAEPVDVSAPVNDRASESEYTRRPPPSSPKPTTDRWLPPDDSPARRSVSNIPVPAVVVPAIAIVGIIVAAVIAHNTNSSQPTASTDQSSSSPGVVWTPPDTLGINPPPNTAPAPTTESATTAQPSINSLPGTDNLGWIGYPAARCDPANQPAAMARTTQSVLVVCQIQPGTFYYRGVRLSDGAGIELANAVRSSGGFDVTNPTDGTRYQIRATSLTIAPPDAHAVSEPMLEFASS